MNKTRLLPSGVYSPEGDIIKQTVLFYVVYFIYIIYTQIYIFRKMN